MIIYEIFNLSFWSLVLYYIIFFVLIVYVYVICLKLGWVEEKAYCKNKIWSKC